MYLCEAKVWCQVDNHCSLYIYKEVSVTICKDSQITVLKMVKIVMFFVNLKHNINMSINFLKFIKISAKNASRSVRTCNM